MRPIAEILPDLKLVLTPRTPEEIATLKERAQLEKRLRVFQNLQSQAQCPRRHWERTIEDCGPFSAEKAKVIGKLGSGFIIALIGIRGTGKTQIAVEALRHNMKERLKSGLYLPVVEFFMLVKNTYRPDAEETEFEVLRRLARPSLLVLDEISKRGATEWENRLLFSLIDKRYCELKDTLMIANTTRPGLSEEVGDALASRLNECGGIIECNWPSRR